MTEAIDFQSSFMTWDVPPRPDPRAYARHNTPLGNKARIQIEARIEVIDEATGAAEWFVLIAPCRTEWVYAENGLFQIPSGEYRMIYSPTEQRSVGRRITHDGDLSRGGPVAGQYRSLDIDIRTFPRCRLLEGPAAINEATAQNAPLVARTEIREAAHGVRWIVDYPIKTMNFMPADGSFQVDTGPLLALDAASDAERTIDRLEMAHIAYNRLDRAEFILRRPTPILDEGGHELCRVLHYSEVREYAARNTVACGEAASTSGGSR